MNAHLNTCWQRGQSWLPWLNSPDRRSRARAYDAPRHPATVLRKRVVPSTIRFVGSVRESRRTRNGPLERRGSHDLLGRPKIMHDVREQPAEEGEAQAFL